MYIHYSIVIFGVACDVPLLEPFLAAKKRYPFESISQSQKLKLTGPYNYVVL